MGNKESTPKRESLRERACRHIKFPFNPFVGRKDESSIDYHLGQLGECVSEIEEQGGDPTELIDVVEEISKNCGGLSHFKQGKVASIMRILMGRGSKKFP